VRSVGRVAGARVELLGVVAASLALLAQAGTARASNTRPSRAYGLPPGTTTGPLLLSPAQTAAQAPAGVPGLDVSNWQRVVDWRTVAHQGYRFAMVKASEGTAYVDPWYASNRSHANLRGLLVGAYDFARPRGVNVTKAAANGAAEADFFLAAATPRPGDLRPALDMETTGGLPPVKLQAWIAGWVHEVRSRLGYRPVIYSSPYFWQTAVGDSPAFARQGARLWQAQWTSAAQPSIPANDWDGHGWTAWQWSDCGRVAGVAGCVDMDVAHRSTGLQNLIMGVPQNGVLPRVRGPLTAGQLAGAGLGSWWAPAPATYRVHWGRCRTADPATCTGIAHTGPTYRLKRADAGLRIRVVVDAHDRYGDTWIASLPSPVVSG
jgi:GH25 family lysozyme M1 (1,4-beta-N-acetylmuramidase)